MESSLCLKLFSDSSSQFGEDLKPKKPLQSNSYIYIPFILPGLLFRATTSLLVPLSSSAGATPHLEFSPSAHVHLLCHLQFSWPAPLYPGGHTQVLHPGSLLSFLSSSSSSLLWSHCSHTAL